MLSSPTHFCVIVAFLLLFTSKGAGQNPVTTAASELAIEAWLESHGQDADQLHVHTLALEELLENPLDINNAELHDLFPFFFLSEQQKKDIIQHIQLYGPLVCAEELQTIPSMGQDEIHLIRPYVKVDKKSEGLTNGSTLLKNGTSTLFLKTKTILQSSPGYTHDSTLHDQGYLGSPQYYSLRYRWKSKGHVSLGFIAEKDAGEKVAWTSSMRLMDHYSGFIQFKPWHWIENMILGDYSVSMGQGLICHTGFGTGKSILLSSIKKIGPTFRPYTSINENGYYRGVAVTLQINRKWDLSLLYSQKPIDAVLSDTLKDNKEPYITSILTSGYHRSKQELSAKHNSGLRNAGGRITFETTHFKLGINFLTYHYQHALSNGHGLYRLHENEGKRLAFASLDFDGRYKNINTFGELATNHKGAFALTIGALLSLDKKMDFSFLIRNFDKSYHSPENSALSEASKPLGEFGIYLGTELRPHFQWKVCGYADFYQFNWLTYTTDGLSQGSEFSFKLEHTLRKKLSVYVQYFFENKEQNAPSDYLRLTSLHNTKRTKLRCHLNHQVHKNWELRSRVELVQYSHILQKEKGYSLYQDIIFQPMSSPFGFCGRFMLFQSNGYNSRIFNYENDIMNEYALPFVTGTGKRAYFVIKYKWTRYLSTELKFSHTRYSDKEIISENTSNEILESDKTEVKFQIKFSW